MELKHWEMELARPYRLWVNGKWFCVDEVTINKYVHKNNTVIYTIEKTDYRRIARIGDRYERVLDAIEKYHDDNAEHHYEKIATFNSFDAAVRYVDEHYPAINFEKELVRYYSEFDDDDDDEI